MTTAIATNTIDLLDQAATAANQGDTETVERCFDAVTNWLLGDGERDAINRVLYSLARLADMGGV